MAAPRNPTVAQVDEVCRRYAAGEVPHRIAASLGVATTSVFYWLRRRGVTIRSASLAHRRFAVNESFFTTIDNGFQAYWLGFLAADGSLYSGNRLELNLAIADRSHLEKFRDAIGSTHPIRDAVNNHNKPFCRLSIRSSLFARDLGLHTVTPAKTFTLRWPILEPHLYADFSRGYIDGDGCFTGGSPKRPANVEMSVTGNGSFITSLQVFLMTTCGLNRTKLAQRYPQTPIYTLHYHGRRQLRRIYDALYANAAVCLDRKREKLHELTREPFGRRPANSVKAYRR